jgi:hypothetical protein
VGEAIYAQTPHANVTIPHVQNLWLQSKPDKNIIWIQRDMASKQGEEVAFVVRHIHIHPSLADFVGQSWVVFPHRGFEPLE